MPDGREPADSRREPSPWGAAVPDWVRKALADLEKDVREAEHEIRSAKTRIDGLHSQVSKLDGKVEPLAEAARDRVRDGRRLAAIVRWVTGLFALGTGALGLWRGWFNVGGP